MSFEPPPGPPVEPVPPAQESLPPAGAELPGLPSPADPAASFEADGPAQAGGPALAVGPAQPAGRRHGWSLGLAVFNGLVLILAGLAAFALFALGLFSPANVVEGSGALYFSYAWMGLVVTLAQVPPLVLSVARLLDRRLPALPPFWLGPRAANLLLLLAWPLILLAGWLLGSRPGLLFDLLGGGLQVLALVIPLYWLVQLGRRGLEAGSSQRAWGLVSVSTAFTMPVILVAELLGLVFIFAAAILVLSLQPGMASQLSDLARSINQGGADPQRIANLLEPYLQQPGMVFLGLGLVAGLMPMLEELLKPMAAWFLLRRSFTPAEGFSAGLVAGACFALLESFSAVTSGSLLPSPGLENSWVGMVVLRSATGVIHVACSGLVGWGLAEAWHNRRPLRLVGLYLLASALHGTWNALAVLQGFAGLFDPQLVSPIFSSEAFTIGGMLLVLALSFTVLVLGNRRLRPAAPI